LSKPEIRPIFIQYVNVKKLAEINIFGPRPRSFRILKTYLYFYKISMFSGYVCTFYSAFIRFTFVPNLLYSLTEYLVLDLFYFILLQ
jgi:hypothetical protein